MRDTGLAGRTAYRLCTTLISLLIAAVFAAYPAAASESFAAWRDGLRREAVAGGIRADAFDKIMGGVTPDLSLPDLILPGREKETSGPGQAEFVKTPAEYLNERSLNSFAQKGRDLARQWSSVLARIEKEIGVPGSVVLAIWARETAFGTYRLPHYGVRVLATQAYTGRRQDKFRAELLAALRLIQDGQIARDDFKTSWAGAFGLTQFMPSDFDKYAIDFDGDGRRDLFRSVPDALASAARQLRGYGWKPGVPWAFEVKAPARLDCTLEGLDDRRPLADWLKLGFARIDGKAFPASMSAEPMALVLPAAVYGPAFLVTENYFAIKNYNFADLYVLYVGTLSDRIAGGKGFQKPWSSIKQVSERDAAFMQDKLRQQGLYDGKIDGKVGMQTRNAIGAYQKRAGLTQDCWPTRALIDALRK